MHRAHHAQAPKCITGSKAPPGPEQGMELYAKPYRVLSWRGYRYSRPFTRQARLLELPPIFASQNDPFPPER